MRDYDLTIYFLDFITVVEAVSTMGRLSLYKVFEKYRFFEILLLVKFPNLITADF